MTPEETVVLARYVRAMYPQTRLDEFTPDAWHDVLAPYGLEDARAAVVQHVQRGNAFISAGEIVTEIRRTRNARIEAAGPYTGIDGTWAQEMTAMRRRNTALASGEFTERSALPASGESFETTRKGAAMLRAAGISVFSKRPEFAAGCPHCNAQPGKPCVDGAGRRRHTAHPSRLDASRAVAAGHAAPTRADLAEETSRLRAASAHATGHLTESPEPNDGMCPCLRGLTLPGKTACAACTAEAATS